MLRTPLQSIAILTMTVCSSFRSTNHALRVAGAGGLASRTGRPSQEFAGGSQDIYKARLVTAKRVPGSARA